MKICPLCRRNTQWENNPFRPFCSERCQLIDLGSWASEDYAVSETVNGPSRLSSDELDSNQDP